MPDERRYRRDRQRNRDRDREKKDQDDGKKIILAKKETPTIRPNISGPSHSQPKLLLKPKEPVERSPSQTKTTVEVPDHTNSDLGISTLSLQSAETPLMKQPCKLLSSELVFNIETISSYIQEQSNDFLVVALIGPQNAGKSTLANLLINPLYNLQEKDTFETRSKQHVVQLGQITQGIDIFITKDRLMVLDCAPLLSNSLYKDYILSELDDLKILTFLLNVCNLVILVQEKYINPNVVRLVHASEMMKTRGSSNEDEHLAKLMLVQNKMRHDELTVQHAKEMKSVYKTIFKTSNINCYLLQSTSDEKEKMAENINFIGIPDFKDTSNPDRTKRIVENFRMQVLMSKRYTTKHTQVTQYCEKMWLQSLTKTWDSQASNYFFKKYGNLKEKFNLLNHVSISDGTKYDKNVYYPDD